MSVYTRRLGVVSGTAPNVWLEIFRAPPAPTAVVVRDLIVTNASTLPIDELAVRVRPVARAGEWWIYYHPVFEIGTVHLDMRQVVEPGEALEVFSSSTGTYVAVTGYVFD